MCHHIKIYLPYSHKGEQHDHHRASGISPPADSACEYMVHTVEEGEENVHPEERGACLDNTLVTGKQTNRRIGIHEQHCRNHA